MTIILHNPCPDGTGNLAAIPAVICRDQAVIPRACTALDQGRVNGKIIVRVDC